MKKISCLIVDDEPLSVVTITQYCARLPEITILGQTNSVANTLEVLEKLKPDQLPGLVFLDIKLPSESGWIVLEACQAYNRQNPKNLVRIIVTTANPAFEKSIPMGIGFLAKPFTFESFHEAISNLFDLPPFITQDMQASLLRPVLAHSQPLALLNEWAHIPQVHILDQINYIKALGQTTAFHMVDNSILTIPIEFCTLPGSHFGKLFWLVSEDCLINPKHIKFVVPTGTKVKMAGGQQVHLTSRYRDQIKNLLLTEAGNLSSK